MKVYVIAWSIQCRLAYYFYFSTLNNGNYCQPSDFINIKILEVYIKDLLE